MTITVEHAKTFLDVLDAHKDIELIIRDVPLGLSEEEIRYYVIQKVWDVLLAMEERVRSDVGGTA